MWVRLQPDAVDHPKIVPLTDVQFRVWIALLSYCAEFESPAVDVHLSRVIPRLSRATLNRFEALGLLDRNGKGWVVHDWFVYSDAPLEDKVAAYLAAHPDASANAVAREIPARRGDVLAEVKRQRNGGVK